MDVFDTAELKGREIFQTYLDTKGIKGNYTKDKLNSVDCYFDSKGKKFVAELKVRYDYYDDFMIEVDKLKALLYKKQQYNLNCAYYVCFFGNSMYMFTTDTIKNTGTFTQKWCKRHTVLNDGYVLKDVVLVPTKNGTVFLRKRQVSCGISSGKSKTAVRLTGRIWMSSASGLCRRDTSPVCGSRSSTLSCLTARRIPIM